jgi:hypothetical protein
MPAFLHTNRLLGHAMDLTRQPAHALHYFEKEALAYPFSALNAGLRLGTMQKYNYPPDQIAVATALFKRTMEMRKLNTDEFPKLLKNPALDDEPLVK